MTFTKRLRVLAAFVPALPIIIATACSNEREPSLVLDRSVAPIIGGVPDSTEKWAVGISIGGGAICSGTLIAPNLVLTARHCVSQTAEQLDCVNSPNTSKVFGNYPTSSFKVYTGSQIGSGTAYSVDFIRYPDAAEANRLCGYDLALLELRKPTGGYPTAWKAPSFVVPVRAAYVAIGYGCQNPEDLNGGGCAPMGTRMLLDPISLIDVDPQDFTIAGRVCGGDSGGPIWDRSTDRVLGALSRGDGTTQEMGPGCNYGIYTRTDVHAAWLQKYGKMAATNGGYAALPWMSETPPPPPVDAGKPDTAPAPLIPIGGSCAAPARCETGLLCADFGDGDLKCTKKCGTCPADFTCVGDDGSSNGFCMATVEPSDAAVDVAPTTPAGETMKTSSCHVGTSTPPPRPQPWIAASALGIALAIARRRR